MSGIRNDPLHILFPFVGDSVGGSHLSALLLINALPKTRFTSTIVLHRPGPLADYLDEHDVAFTYLDGVEPVEDGGVFGQCKGMLAAARHLTRFMRENGIDIVHTNDARMHLTWAIAAWVGAPKHIWHQRSADNSRRLSMYSKLAPCILTISNHCKNALNPGIGLRAEVIYDPFNTISVPPAREESSLMLRQEAGLSGVEFVIGFVGNLTGQKRPLDFVEAAAKLHDRFGDRVGFVMLGELRANLYEAVCDSITQNKMMSRIILMGPKHPIEPWIAGLDILLASATNEGLGRTLVEAALVGTPVVATDDGGHREVIKNGETGYLVPIEDAGAMANCVAGLLVDPLKCRDIAQRAYESADARFSIEGHVKAISNVYERLMQ